MVDRRLKQKWGRLLITARFSLRTLMTVMLFAAVFFAWFGWRLRKSGRQSQAVGVLQSFGAICAYDFQSYQYGRQSPTIMKQPLGKPTGVAGQSKYPSRLRQALGIDFLHNVTRVHIETTYRLSDAEIDLLWDALADLPDLVSLTASGLITKPMVVQRLRNASRLERLVIRWGSIGSEDLAVLSQMPRLQELTLSDMPLKDADITHLGRVPSLRSIELQHTKVTGAGMAAVASIQKLKRLRLGATRIGDEGMRHLGAMRELIALDLANTGVTDQGLEEMASLKKLETLDLSMNPITEQGIRHLAGLTHLKHLVLELTNAGPEGLQTLPRLASLEELFVKGSIVSGDLSPLGECNKLRILSCPLLASNPINIRLNLPSSLEEVSFSRLSDVATFDQLASLPNLSVLHAHFSSFEAAELEAVNRFKLAKPRVQVLNR